METITIETEYIRLDALLKLAGLAETGGQAKVMIQGGEVTVNGELCTQRANTLRPGAVADGHGRQAQVQQA